MLKKLIVVLIPIIIVSFLFKSKIYNGFVQLKNSMISEEKLIKESKVDRSEPWAQLKLTEKFSGFESPVYLTSAGDGSNRIFVVESKGIVKVVIDNIVLEQPYLDISDKVAAGEPGSGLLSLAFHPQFKRNKRFFVYYTDKEGNVIISEYKQKTDDQADETKEKIIFKIEQAAANHNGGQLAFGPDNNFYIGLGDADTAEASKGNAQNLDTMIGKILRVNVNSRMTEYAIPYLNPFLRTPTANSKIWAYGVRNPWRFSFDSKTGDLYITDRGANSWEEINFQPSSSEGGENYGWDFFEGFHKFNIKKSFDMKTLSMPVFEYSHDEGCAITGGYVYRGSKYTNIEGTYIFSDLCSGVISGLRKTGDTWEVTEFLDTDYEVSSFGTDEENEIYLIDQKNGSVYSVETELN